MLNPDLIQPVGIQSVVLYPPTVRLERGKMTQLYSTICTYKPYAQFALLPDGARMLNDDGSHVRLGPDRLSYKERIPDSQSTYATVRDYEHTNSVFPFGEFLHFTDKRLELSAAEIAERLRRHLAGRIAGVEVAATDPTFEDVFMSRMGTPDEERSAA